VRLLVRQFRPYLWSLLQAVFFALRSVAHETHLVNQISQSARAAADAPIRRGERRFDAPGGTNFAAAMTVC
jgi:hypothetical protein